MSKLDTELYRAIHSSLVEHFPPETDNDSIMLAQLTMIVGNAVMEYTADLREAIQHLQETVKRQHV